MAITIKDDLLKEVKNHLRVTHTLDDSLIKNEIMASIYIIYENYMLIPSKNADGSENTAFPSGEISVDKLDARVLLALKHMVAMFRSNPDERIEIQAGRTVTNSKVIEITLGDLLRCTF